MIKMEITIEGDIQFIDIRHAVYANVVLYQRMEQVRKVVKDYI